jgi:lysophospholipid acyltransferase (LPLAT)-like uncharacterized protein
MRLRQTWRAWLHRGLLVLVPPLLSGALRLLAKTVRIEYRDAQPLFDAWERGEKVIVAFWHNRVLLMPLPYRGEQMCIMNSQHRDGQIASRTLARWGIRSVQGSATRGGVRGFLALLAAFRRGCDLAVVPDGPRGPRYVAKPGVIHLARATGARIFPATYAAQWKRQLRSWDRLLIPLPFSRVAFVIGAPIVVDRRSDDGEVERKRLELESALNQITSQAEACFSGRTS